MRWVGRTSASGQGQGRGQGQGQGQGRGGGRRREGQGRWEGQDQWRPRRAEACQGAEGDHLPPGQVEEAHTTRRPESRAAAGPPGRGGGQKPVGDAGGAGARPDAQTLQKAGPAAAEGLQRTGLRKADRLHRLQCVLHARIQDGCADPHARASPGPMPARLCHAMMPRRPGRGLLTRRPAAWRSVR